ncbi:hypothetical protein LWI29_038502 [Acer saccharum]|uniref:Uncharacterized protein n=1 Tax=Acer saccharum TaxID=4024 RepID=A0AA39S9B1_ACESA|nr:hypothetical protein LWI29_038502 [Acer saccharum]
MAPEISTPAEPIPTPPALEISTPTEPIPTPPAPEILTPAEPIPTPPALKILTPTEPIPTPGDSGIDMRHPDLDSEDPTLPTLILQLTLLSISSLTQMSLYIGNLSSRTSRDELERVFQRFGQCNVRLKDGYGFVVYNFPPNAEKALRALQGGNICGKPLTLTWSSKQPRPFNRSIKDARSYEPIRQRSSVKGESYFYRKVQSNGLLDHKFGDKQLGRSQRRLNSVDMLDEDMSYPWDGMEDNIREDHHDCVETLPDKGGSVEPNLVDNGRWGEEYHDQLNDNIVENGRYEHYQGFDRNCEDETHRMAYSGGSPAPQSSHEIMGREHLFEGPLDAHIDSKYQQTCYNCGGIGHKMRNCSRAKFSQRKYTSLDHRRADDINRTVRGEGKLERYVSRSQGKLQSTRDSVSMSQLLDDRKTSDSRRHRKLITNESSTKAEEIDRVQKEHHRGKKRHNRDFGNQKKHSEKKANSSSSNFDYIKSRPHSTSRSSIPVPRSGLHSRSSLVSSRAHSPPSDSGSSSTSLYSRSKRSKSRLKSSSHTPLSLSVSPGRSLQSSPNTVKLDLKGILGNAAASKTKEILSEKGLQVGDTRLENAKPENNMLVVENENALSSSKVEDEINKDLPIGRDENGNHTVSTSLYEITNPRTRLSETLKETKQHQNSDASMIAHTSLPIRNQHLEAPDNSNSCRSTSSMPPSEKAMLTARFSSETLKEANEHRIFDASMMEHVPLPIKNQHSEAPVSSYSGCSTSISSDEMFMVLKHYGLELPDDNERHLPPDAYFGSARLWPWQIIYYRRLKKGPISMENYARRVSQNQEFDSVHGRILHFILLFWTSHARLPVDFQLEAFNSFQVSSCCLSCGRSNWRIEFYVCYSVKHMTCRSIHGLPR